MMFSLTKSSLSDSFTDYYQVKNLSAYNLAKENTNEEDRITPTKTFSKEGIKQIFSLITVEPVTFCYACALILHAPLIQQYVYERLSTERNLRTSIDADISSCDVTSNTITDQAQMNARKEVQSTTSYVYLGVILSASIPSLFMALLLGSWSDKVGRKIIIMLPVIGGILDTTCILVTMATSGPLYLLFIGSFLNGVCGFFTTMILAVFSYMADVTAENNRALRLGILEAVAFTSGMISHLSSGWWVRHLGFQAPYIFIITLHLTALMYIVFVLPESLPNVCEKRFGDLFNVSHFHKIYHIFRDTSPKKKWQLQGLLVTSAFLMICSIGFGSVIVLYSLDTPFCLSPILIGYFLAECMFVQAIGAIFALTYLQKFLSEMMLTQIGIFSIISSLLAIAFIYKKWHMFVVPLVGVFGGVCMPVIRARMSKLVEREKQGALFSSVATLETLCTLFGAALFNSLYPITEKCFDMKGFCFLVMAGLLLIPSVILCLIGAYATPDEDISKEKIIDTK